MKVQNKLKKTVPGLRSLKTLDDMVWTGQVASFPVGSVVQYRKRENGEVVYWHLRQSSVQTTALKNKDGKKSAVRKYYIEAVERGELFLTHTL